jgi:hypothetical protein
MRVPIADSGVSDGSVAESESIVLVGMDSKVISIGVPITVAAVGVLVELNLAVGSVVSDESDVLVYMSSKAEGS